jgi:cytochrome c2
MPANEQTWRDTKLMHVVFGVSSVVMLITTVWMMADDHNRPWKDIQRQFRDLDVRSTEWRATEQQSADYESKTRDLERQREAAQEAFTIADRDRVVELFDKFKEGEEAYVKLAKDSGREASLYEQETAKSLKSAAKTLAEEKDPKKVRADRADLIKRLNELVDPLKSKIYFRENNLTADVKDAKAYFSQAQSRFEQAVGRNESPEKLAELQKDANTAKGKVDVATALMQKAVDERKQLEAIIKHVTADEDKVQKALADQRAKVKQFEDAAKERTSNVGKSILEMPILDAFNSPLKPANRWLPALPWNNNFRDVARFDRCETCHLGLERTLPGSAVAAAFPPTSRLTVELATPEKPPLVGAYGIYPGKPGARSVGLVIDKVRPQSLAADAGLKPKDEIRAINDVKMESPAAVEEYLLSPGNGQSRFKLSVHRGEGADQQLEMPAASLPSLYGLQLADKGVFKASDVTIAAVYPRTPAAAAGLMGGDVIEAIGIGPLWRPAQVADYLLAKENWGKSLKLAISRGVPEPFTTHPRLDLFVGSLSPHPVAKFGCTICHQGQGSATAFKWASHTPNSLDQANTWSRDQQWFNNENWTYPMYPHRFEESTCLKCHHEVVELERSHEYPDPPAPKVVAGYEIIRRYGCFGCHEINGFDGKRRIGPDLRLEPNYSAAAAQLTVDPGLKKLGKQAVTWADELEYHPDNDTARRGLSELLAADAKAQKPTLTADSRRMEGVLKDVDNPGTERKVGPSLRHVASKLGFEFITSWVENPQGFRPDTRMPRFFGQWDHLESHSQAGNKPLEPVKGGLEESQRLEPIEVRAIANYLLKSSQPFEYVKPSSPDVERSLNAAGEQPKAGSDEAIARGKKAFQTRGCLACHQHADFKKDTVAAWQDLLKKVPGELRGDDYPELKATQGPDLSRMGAKLQGSKGRQWLYSWIRNPSRYHPRTFMPVLFLEPEKDAEGKEGFDPAADVTEFLMNSQQGWKPANALPEQMSPADEQSLNELALAHLGDKFSTERAKEYLEHGIPFSQADVVQGDEALLINPERKQGEAANETKGTEVQKSDRLARTLQYVGRRSISKHGCYACHDIPGYEDAKPIGTALADWGRKLPSRLAFEQITEYLTHNPHGRHSLGLPDPKPEDTKPAGTTAHAGHEAASASELEAEFSLDDVKAQGEDIAFFTEKLLHEEREGFIWQKLRAPRSYDFKKTENKKYNDRLRMPKFHFAESEQQNQEKIEQVMTFVLGLVAEPPPPAFIYHPTGSKEAIVSGRKVLEKFNCAGCHMLEMERWDLEFKPGELGKAPTVTDFPYVMAHFTSKEIDDSKSLDRRGLTRATIVGMPKVDLKGAPKIEAVEDEDNPSKGAVPTCTFMNFEAALIDGAERVVGKDLQVPMPAVARRYPAVGGDLARYMLPFAIDADEKTRSDYKEKPNEAWGWLPPPLIGEGKKVQTEWLHDFLLDPFQIRPAAVLRMPKFNMSSAEASRLAAYFAAMDGAEYPYEFDVRTRAEHLEAAEAERPKHLEGALGIVVDNNFCVKCHKIGDFSPTGSPRAMAPRLDRVHNRLRPEYTHRWIGDPARVIPYTGMPQNFPPPPAPPVAQNLYKGTSDDQIDALVDLMMNFDRFAQDQISIKSLIKPAAPAAAASVKASDQTAAKADE